MISTKMYPTELSTTPTKEIYYTYDVLGRRMQKQVIDHNNPADVTKTFTRQPYDGQEILLEFDGNATLLARYTHSNLKTDDVLAVDITTSSVDQQLSPSAGTYIFLKGNLGSIQLITDALGQVVQKYSYSAYGNLLGVRDGNDNDISGAPIIIIPFSYTGREYDRESGLYYYRARYYDASIGRFLQQDPEPGKLSLPITVTNKYAYTGNNPTNLTDPSGMSLLGDFFGGKGGWGTDLITAAVTGAILVASGVGFGVAAIAVGSVAGGAALASMAMAAFQGGNFWENTGNNFHSLFRVGATFLALSAIFAPGGVASAGGNGLQGSVVSRNPYFGYKASGLTIGSASTYDITSGLGAHEFGHTLQFIGLSGITGLLRGGTGDVWSVYIGLGGLGAAAPQGAGAWWENMATRFGR